jgi:hypothetical protein
METRVVAPLRGLSEPVRLDGRSVVDISIPFATVVYGIAALLFRAPDWLTERIAEMGYAR